MRRTSRIAIAALAAAALVLPLSACAGSGSSGSGDGTVELSFFHRWPNEPKHSYYADVVAEFEKENPNITVKVENVLNDAYKDKIKVVAGSANAPDVMFTWSGSFVGELVKSDALMDLGPWLKEDKQFADSFYPSQLTPFQVDGTQYGLPVGMQSKLFFYNKDAFAKLGLQPPKTWDEFMTVLKTIKKSGQTPIEYGAQEQWTIAHYVGTLNQRTVDPKVFAADQDPKKGTFTDPGYVEALERFKELAGYMNSDMTAVGHEVARNAWIAGDAPIMYLQSAEVGYLKDVTFDYGTFNFPSVAGGKGDAGELTGAPEGFAISKNTKHPAEAKKFLEFLLSKQNGTAYAEKAGELSPVKGAVEEAKVPEISKELAKGIVDASAMTTWLDNAYDPQIVQAYLSETQLMLSGQQTPEGVMKAVQEAAQRVRDAS
ncbi:ABC transporter substrate-binding protein [Microbacterium dextranolyticum]|uniref:ABC transporter extracellular-binding protein YurO n=1 Tax=Microbacterium dextranolyticum TaxID=36806 RepID=A0A9W6HL13_9MICO|nr:extracellular solute-binding protein [Microbacterium dextranolyticum]MBM7464126.1 raffinose/stachyose/melibiose transport system substrate-binding protein [Microbacterium dextranolyticum]GLJ95121.1 putative ABC transporter extracellular-binding protein YurO [Microbacterium dextranolyticum]